MKVEQFKNDKGKLVMNHLVIRDESIGLTLFQSYSSLIVRIKNGKVTLGKDWKFSAITSKYRSMFLGESTKVTQAKLDSGEYLYDENL
jgi:hypothetical protein